MLNSNAFHVLPGKPTRITPDAEMLIDHVISNIRPDAITGIVNHDIIDHPPISCPSITANIKKNFLTTSFEV